MSSNQSRPFFSKRDIKLGAISLSRITIYSFISKKKKKALVCLVVVFDNLTFRESLYLLDVVKWLLGSNEVKIGLPWCFSFRFDHGNIYIATTT